LPKCQYRLVTFPPEIEFDCNEESRTNSKFCIFHDKNHYVEYEQDAVKRFEEKVLESVSKNKPLGCIDYLLPDIKFTKLIKEKNFSLFFFFLC
jgi:hypothetical protein